MSLERTTLLLTTSTKTATVCSPSVSGQQFAESPDVIPIRPLEVLDEETARELALYIALDSLVAPQGIESGLYEVTKNLVTADPVNGLFFKFRNETPLGQPGLLSNQGWAEMYLACLRQLSAIDDAEILRKDIEATKRGIFAKVVEHYYDWCGASYSCQENLAAAVMQEPRRNIRQRCEEVSERFLNAIQFLQKDPQNYLYRLSKTGPKTQDAFWQTALFSHLPEPGEKPESAILDAIEQLTGKSHRSAKRYRQAMKIKLAP